VYVDTFAREFGPVVAAQFVIPVTPVIVQLPNPVGATAADGPVTVAVNVTVPPSAAVEAFAETATVGVAVVTVVVSPEVGAVAK
jgi:hypothetical protein